MHGNSAKPPLCMIGGPTASGKTAAAITLAARENGVVINTDAMQVYRDLPILTAQPSETEKEAAPHKLFEIFDPAEKSSVGRWLALAKQEIKAAAEAGKTPILVGGTGLYFAALLGLLADIPEIPNEVRIAAADLYDEIGSEAFRGELAKLDAGAAQHIKPNDRQRLIRAYEVVRHTGKTLSQWQEEGKAESIEKDFTVWQRVIQVDRAELYARCDARFVQMIERGALDEVRALLARNLDPELPAMKILGVPELAAHLRGEITLDDAIAKAQQATRNYAKRQLTWFRNQWGEEA